MVPESLLEVVTAAQSVALVDLDTLKGDLGITSTADDARLDRVIAASARQIAAYVGRDLVEQEYRETWRLPPGGVDYWSVVLPRDQISCLPLQRYPVTVFSSVDEAGTVLDPSLYQWMDGKGVVRLDANGGVTGWASGVIRITYKAGWIGAKGTIAAPQVALPDDLYEAALLAARTAWYAKDRDPGQVVRSEMVPELYSVTYDTRAGFGGDVIGEGSYGLPPAVTAVLDAYRRSSFAF